MLYTCRCMCGAPNCRGTMDTQPERFKDFGKRLDVFWDGDSVFYRGTVTAYSTTTRKHTILYDDNDVERVNLEVRDTAKLLSITCSAVAVGFCLPCTSRRMLPCRRQHAPGPYAQTITPVYECCPTFRRQSFHFQMCMINFPRQQ